jgi:hypothetical protein
VRTQRSRIAKLERRRAKVKEAFYADAMGIDELKQEQLLIGRQLIEAQTIIDLSVLHLEDLEKTIDWGLALLADPAGFYLAAPTDIRQMLVQELFEAIWIIDDKIVDARLTKRYQDLLDIEGTADAVSAAADGGTITYLRTAKNLRPDNKAEGSDLQHLVGLTGFEPAASSSRTRRATKLRHSPIAGTGAPVAEAGRQASASIPEQRSRPESRPPRRTPASSGD